MTADLQQWTSSFIALMRSKGYAGNFALSAHMDKLVHFSGSLQSCLDRLIPLCHQQARPQQGFTLSTYAELKGPSDFKLCVFSVMLDTKKGLTVKELKITSRPPDEQQHLRFTDNQQVPGSHAVVGRFRRPKPWDDMAKGKILRRR